jgi:hypothetical protein
MTSLVSGTRCALCGQPATVMIAPTRRTLVRGLDPDDPSYSVTAILPDIPLCDDHASDVDDGDRLVGWCDDERCRVYGEVGESSACGAQYKTLVPAIRSRSALPRHPSK